MISPFKGTGEHLTLELTLWVIEVIMLTYKWMILYCAALGFSQCACVTALTLLSSSVKCICVLGGGEDCQDRPDKVLQDVSYIYILLLYCLSSRIYSIVVIYILYRYIYIHCIVNVISSVSVS